MARVAGREGRTDVLTTTDGAAAIASLRRVSWGAIFGGVVISLIVQFLLSMLGVGIGVATVDPASGEMPGAATFSMSAAIWWTVAGIIAAFAGGWVAARLAGAPLAASGALHGLVTWATTMLVVLYLLTTAVSTLIGGAFGVLGSTVSGAGSAITGALPDLAGATQGPLGELRREVEQVLQGGGSPAERARALATVARAITSQDMTQAERDQAAGTLAQQAGISQQEAAERLNNWRETYQRNAAQIEAQARQSAEATARNVSRASILGFVALILGAIAGALGGRMGASREAAVATTIPIERGNAQRATFSRSD